MSQIERRTDEVPLILRLAGLWVIWAAWCSVSGWTLSALQRLDGWGHTALLPVLGIAWWQWLKSTAPAAARPVGNFPARLRRRLLRPLPLLYLVIAALSLLGGLLYLPWSSDAVNYRFPRLLSWWGAHQWHWIGTVDHRLDFSSCGFEWQMLPVIELTHSDRLLFLLNWIPFLLIPGLTFFAFRSLGTSGRSARRWMWLLPTGYCFALQAGSVQNDGYSVNYLLAAIGFAVVAFRTGRTGCFFMSLIAAALLTGAKLSNLPLFLPLGVLLRPVSQYFAVGQVSSVASAIVASALVILSFLSTGIGLILNSINLRLLEIEKLVWKAPAKPPVVGK